jgi:hypothetical protein
MSLERFGLCKRNEFHLIYHKSQLLKYPYIKRRNLKKDIIKLLYKQVEEFNKDIKITDIKFTYSTGYLIITSRIKSIQEMRDEKINQLIND